MTEPHASGYLIAAEHTRRDWLNYPDAAGDLGEPRGRTLGVWTLDRQ